MTTRILQFYIVVTMALLMGCSLLKFELTSDAVPLTPEQQQLRAVAREFGEVFFTAVEKTASTIQESDADAIYKENAILWKINAEAVAIDAIYKNQPAIAFIDMWAFTVQMENFIKSEKGKALFGKWSTLVLDTSIKMRENITRIGKKHFKPKEYKQIIAFINSYASKNPITDITFKRYPIYGLWLAQTEAENEKQKNKNKEEREVTPTTVGTLPEVMSDISDRMAAISRQLQKNVLWQTELLALNGDIDVKLLGKTVDNVYYSSTQLKDIFLNKEQSMDYFAAQLSTQMRPIIDDVDTMVNSYIISLEKESSRFTSALTQERVALEALVEKERTAILEKINEIRTAALDQVMNEITNLVKSVLWLLIILFAVVLCIPFGFGVMFGKLLSLRKKSHL